MNIWKIRYLPGKIANAWTIRRRKVRVGQGTEIYGKLIIKGDGKISIGENCLINSSIHADPIGGDSVVILRADRNAELVIGNRCGLSNCAIVAQEKVIIHDEVFLGGGCKIYDTDFHSLDRQERVSEDKSHVKTGKVEIMDGAFIGAHAIILKGVTIGRNSVIGAGSVVTKQVPDNEIWAGNPARKVRDV